MEKKNLTIEDLWEMPEDERYSSQVLSEVTSDNLVKILDEYVLSGAEKEKLISELQRRDPSFVYTENEETDLHEGSIKYPALNTLVVVYKILGWILIIGGVLGALAYIEESVIASIAIAIGGVIFGIMALAAAESIKVMTDISSFSYQILKHLKSKD